MAKKILMGAVSVVVLLVVLPILVLQFPFVQDAVTRRALDSLNQRIPGTISVERIRGNFISGLRVEGAAIEHEGDVVATAQEIEFAWNPAALLARRISVTSLAVRHARISLERAADERLRLAAAFSQKSTEPERPDGGPFAWTVAIGSLQVADVLATLPATEGTERYWVNQGDLAGRFADERIEVEIESLTGATSSPRLELTGAQGNVSVDIAGEAPTIALEDVTLSTAGSRVAINGSLDLESDGSVRLALTGNPVSPTLLEVLGVPIRLPVTLDLVAEGPWDGFEFRTSLHSGGAALTLAGTATLPFTAPASPAVERASLSASGRVERFLPNAWFGKAAPEETEINAALAVTAVARVNGNPQIRMQLDGAGSRIGGHPVRSFSGEVSLENQIAAASVRLLSPRGDARISARYDTSRKNYRARIKVQELHPEDFLGAAWEGALTFSVALDGEGTTLETLAGKARINVSPSRLAGYQIERIRLPLVIRQGRMIIDDGRIEAEPLDVRIAGNLPIDRERKGTLRILARTENIGLLLPPGEGEKPEGRAMLHAVVKGSLEQMRANLIVRAQTIRVGGMSFPDLDVDVEIKNGNVLARTGTVEALVKASLPDLGVIGFDSLQVAASLQQETGHQEGTFLVSTLTAGDENRLRGRYELDFPGVVITLEDFALKVQQAWWRNAGEAVLDTRGEGVTVSNLDLQSGEQRIAVDGKLDVSGSQQITLHLNRVQLAPFSQLLGAEGEFAGQLDGTAWVSGTMQKPKVESTFALVAGAVRGYQIEMATIVVSYADAWLDGQVRLAQSEETGALVGEVRLPVALGEGDKRAANEAGRRISGRIVSENLSLQIVRAFTPEVADVRGRVNVDVTLTGTLDEPRIRGQIGIAEGAFRVVKTDVAYVELTLEGEVKNTYFQLSRIRLRSEGGGEFSAKGRIPIPVGTNDGRITVDAIAEDFLVVANKQAEARVDARLAIRGNLATPRVSGNIESERVVIFMPKGEQKQLAPVEFEHAGIFVVGEMPATDEGAPEQNGQVRLSLLERAEVDVKVGVERNAWVRGDDANIELRGELKALKQAGEEHVRISGEIRTVRGYYRLRSKRLMIEEGAVSFTGTQQINPLLNVSLSYESPDYEIGVHVTGTTQKPNLSLTSQPPLETADIVAVLIFGKPFAQLGGGETTEMRERVGSLLGGFAAEQLRDQLGGRLGIDTLEIKPSGEADEEGAEIGVGKYVSEDVFVQYVQRFGREAASEVRLEYYFTTRWLIQTSASTEGESGADIFWNITF
jgi:translocation and assembly module TamB